MIGGVFGGVVPWKGSGACSLLQGVRRLLGGGALLGSSELLTEGPRPLPFVFFPSPFSITVSGSSTTGLVWCKVPVDFRPAIGLVVRLGWGAGVVPMSARPAWVSLVVRVGGGVGGDWVSGDMEGSVGCNSYMELEVWVSIQDWG